MRGMTREIQMLHMAIVMHDDLDWRFYAWKMESTTEI